VQEDVIDAAVLTQRDEHHLPTGRVARCREEILACAGSSFISGPTLETLQNGPWGNERIGIVGLPCQILAMAKMRYASHGDTGTPAGGVGLTIGLFCTWALSYRPFIDFVRDLMNGREIQRMEITPPPDRILRVIGERSTQEMPVDDIRRFIRPGCTVCLDMTSELADISVGALEGRPDWNTIVVRTSCGDALVRNAEAAGVIVTQSLSNSTVDHLKEAARLKRKRALQTLASRGELQDGYLIISEETQRRILQQPGGRE
jgi:coenzyme F420 hydrogenase subunit beta